MTTDITNSHADPGARRACRRSASSARHRQARAGRRGRNRDGVVDRRVPVAGGVARVSGDGAVARSASRPDPRAATRSAARAATLSAARAIRSCSRRCGAAVSGSRARWNADEAGAEEPGGAIRTAVGSGRRAGNCGGSVRPETHGDNVIARAATVARLLRDTPPALDDAAVASASTEFVPLSRTDAPLVGAIGTGKRASAIAAELSAALDAGRERIKVAPLRTRHPHHGKWQEEEQLYGRVHDERPRSWPAARAVHCATGTG